MVQGQDRRTSALVSAAVEFQPQRLEVLVQISKKVGARTWAP
jgi:uncharacterized integral membrane protein